VAAQGVAYDIVGEHSLDVSSVLLRQLSKVSGPEQTLLFTCHRHEYDRRVELIGRHHSRHLQDGCSSGSVIVRSGSVALLISGAGTHRIVVTTDDIKTLFRFGLASFERRYHIRNHSRAQNSLGFLL